MIMHPKSHAALLAFRKKIAADIEYNLRTIAEAEASAWAPWRGEVFDRDAFTELKKLFACLSGEKLAPVVGQRLFALSETTEGLRREVAEYRLALKQIDAVLHGETSATGDSGAAAA